MFLKLEGKLHGSHLVLKEAALREGVGGAIEAPKPSSRN